MKTATVSTGLQKGRIRKAVQLWHKVSQLQQEAIASLEEDANSLEVQRGACIVRSLPEIRSDRVAMLRAQVEAGTYQVNSIEIAQKMLGISPAQIPGNDENDRP